MESMMHSPPPGGYVAKVKLHSKLFEGDGSLWIVKKELDNFLWKS